MPQDAHGLRRAGQTEQRWWYITSRLNLGTEQRLAISGGNTRPGAATGKGVPAWSAAWAAATSCAVSASMTIFRRNERGEQPARRASTRYAGRRCRGRDRWHRARSHRRPRTKRYARVDEHVGFATPFRTVTRRRGARFGRGGDDVENRSIYNAVARRRESAQIARSHGSSHSRDHGPWGVAGGRSSRPSAAPCPYGEGIPRCLARGQDAQPGCWLHAPCHLRSSNGPQIARADE
jgi:hypothetical protein